MKASAKMYWMGACSLVFLLNNGYVFSAHSTTSANMADIGTIMSAWENRQAKAASVRVSWRQLPSKNGHWFSYQMEWSENSQMEHTTPESVLLLDQALSRYETNRWYVPIMMEYSGFTERGKSHYSPEDTFYRFYFHDTPQDSYRRALRNRFCRPADQQRLPRRFVSVCDGISRRDFFDKGDGEYAQAIIFDWATIAGGLDETLDHLQFRPLILLYRPLHPAMGAIRPESCRLVAKESFANGGNCLVVEESQRDRVVNKYWVDPDRDFVVVRQIAEQAGAARAQLDISYKQDSELGWCPTGWTTMVFPRAAKPTGHERLIHCSCVEVNRIDVNSASIRVDFRDCVIPKGALVVNRTSRDAFIMLANNQKRMITKTEAADPNVTYRKLTTSMLEVLVNLLWQRVPLLILLSVCIVFGRFTISRLLSRQETTSPNGLTALGARSYGEIETEENVRTFQEVVFDRAACPTDSTAHLSADAHYYRPLLLCVKITGVVCVVATINIMALYFPSELEQSWIRIRMLMPSATDLFFCVAVVALGIATGLKKRKSKS